MLPRPWVVLVQYNTCLLTKKYAWLLFHWMFYYRSRNPRLYFSTNKILDQSLMVYLLILIGI
ncbi:hypothetical protein BDA96_01G015400 [Sorghum bicolor]|uniref:Uncharacterized protein n=1 Tax=Sorghum bicolor TaxID=4558 RepID=A0A921UX49_SORBI|nr:hypothetical protein BDA96_01G015400 [Sorghum bicolor]